MKNTVWVTWENQRRNRELCSALGIKLYEWKEIDAIKNPAKKYSRGIGMTAGMLMREKPSIVFCQNPSIVLSSFVLGMKKKAGFMVCVDAHNAGLFPKEGRSKLMMLLSRLVQKNADLTIVTNEGLRKHVEMNGGRPFILPDKIPDIPVTNPVKLKGAHNILFICSYAEDEPYELVFEAAKELPNDVHIYVTGNFHKRKIDAGSVPANVELMGYVPEDTYVSMLNSVDGTIDLTDRENCLVCGAYESVAAGKPQVLSDTAALKNYFNKGVVFTTHSSRAIRLSIEELIENKHKLESETQELKKELNAEWAFKKSDLERIVTGKSIPEA